MRAFYSRDIRPDWGPNAATTEDRMNRPVPAISTAGRIFVAQLTREIAAREIVGANLLSPGAKHWHEAFRSFAESVSKSGSPVKAGAMLRAAIGRLHEAQNQRCCFINCFVGRKRSAYFHLLTYEVSKHPLIKTGYEGILVLEYHFRLQRNGRITAGLGGKLAFLSWHALARLRERSTIDIFDASGVVAGCGWAGLIMRESDRHLNTELNFCIQDICCTGPLRSASTDHGTHYGFYDVLTVLPLDDDFYARNREKVLQGIAIAKATLDYYRADDSDITGYAEKIAVLPFRGDDYVSRELSGDTGALSHTTDGNPIVPRVKRKR